jgi:hypothetical protein
MEDGDRSLLQRPNNPVARTVRGNTRDCARIGEGSRASRDRHAVQARIREGKCAEIIAHRSVIKHTVEISRRARGPGAAERAGQILINRAVRDRIELPHVISIDDVNVQILARAHSKMSNDQVTIDHIGQ